MDNSMPVSNSSFNGNCIDSQQNGQLNGQLNGTQNIPSPYTFPAILHYLQYEWQKLEQEKQQWMIERAELQAQLTIMEGRVMSQFNLKKDLIRRIKMLEYCLRAERAKYHKLKYGVEPPPLHIGEDDGGEFKSEQLNENHAEITTNTSWKKGRHLLRQYLMEIGYTDAIINIRSNRVRYLLGLQTAGGDDAAAAAGDEANDGQSAAKEDGGKAANKKPTTASSFMPAASKFLASEAESSVDETIAFLKGQSNSMQNEEPDDDDDVIDSETEEVLSEFNFLSAHQSNTTVVNTLAAGTGGPASGVSSAKPHNLDIGELANITPNDEWKSSQPDDAKEKAQIDLKQALFGGPQEWMPRFILKSHFDCVRCLKFHGREPLIVTGSDDETVKLWNLNKPLLASNKNKITQDLEPVYTFRGHKSPVLSLLIIDYLIFSGGMNGEILVWRIPEDYGSIDPYETYDPSLFLGSLDGHTDTVWSLVAVPPTADSSGDDPPAAAAAAGSEAKSSLICSASADGTIKVWDVQQRTCVKTIVCDENLGRPTCLAALPSNATLDSPSNIDSSAKQPQPTAAAGPEAKDAVALSQLLAASFSRGFIQIFDLNSSTYSTPVLNLESPKAKNYSSTSTRINAIVVHPTLTVIVSAHQDRNLRFWDYTTGECFQEMVAHLDEITCLDMDLNGLYLLSGGHDCSVRLWSFDTKRCIKETKSHLEKFSEAVLGVSFHPTQKFFATSGTDAKAICFCISSN